MADKHPKFSQETSEGWGRALTEYSLSAKLSVQKESLDEALSVISEESRLTLNSNKEQIL